MFVNLKLIKDYIKKNGLTYQQFCEKARIDIFDFKKLIIHDHDIDVLVLLKIAKILNIHIRELFTDQKI